jgi:hypothetical protein
MYGKPLRLTPRLKKATNCITVVAHPDRQDQAFDLSDQLLCPVYWDQGHNDPNGTHDQAWDYLHGYAVRSGSEWCTLLEDDCQPIKDMTKTLSRVLTLVPEQGICSLYTGTGRPPQFQRRVQQAHTLATLSGATFIRHDYLLWGVGVSIRTDQIPDMLKHVARYPRLPYDFRIGQWLRANSMHCYYTTPSLVDHEDCPTLIQHVDGEPRTEPRKAWSLGAPSLNGVYVDL